MLRFRNTLSGEVEEFVPLEDNEVRIYACGPTVYNFAHIGNFRTFVFYDVVHRYLRYRDYRVTLVMNLTDVDDKTIKGCVKDGVPLADAMTASPYLGLDSVEPFLAACRRHGAGVFFLVRTSNAGAADVQDLAMSDGNPLWHHVAQLVREWGEPLVGASGMSSVGAVVGATHPRAVSEARRLLPHSPMLLPGVGAQGATPADVARAFTAGPASALVTASRSVIFAYRESEADWRSAAGAEAQQLAAQVWAAAGW